VSGREVSTAAEGGLHAASADRRWERLPFGLVLLVVWTVALLALALLATGGLSGVGSVLGHVGSPGGPPAYQELPGGSGPLGRDLVIAPADVSSERIEALVNAVAAEAPAGVLRINVFTDAAAAQRRRELIGAGTYAKDFDESDPPEWRAVYPAWVAVYTRDPAEHVNQLSLCLNDPDHSHCTVKRYPAS
jgi:hypothetical protein